MEIRSVAAFTTCYEAIRRRMARIVELVPDEPVEWRHAARIEQEMHHLVVTSRARSCALSAAAAGPARAPRPAQ